MNTGKNTFANPAAYQALRASKTGQELIAESEEEAANFVFDLDSGERNAELKTKFTGHEIYTMVTMAASTTFTKGDKEFTVHSYYEDLPEEKVLELLQDVQVRFEQALLRSALPYETYLSSCLEKLNRQSA